MVETRQLMFFITLAEELNFTRAAEREFISVSGFAQQIRKLERSLGVRIVDRTTRTVALTRAGAVVLEHARRVERELRALDRVAEAFGGQPPLRVGYSSHGVGAAMPRLLAAANDLLDARLELVELDFVAHFTSLEAGRVDVVLARLPIPANDRLQIRVLSTEARRLAVATGHPLAMLDRPVEPNDTRGESWFALPDGVPIEWDRYFAPVDWSGDGPRGPVVSTASEALFRVAAGQGVALVPASLAESYPGHGVRFLAADGLVSQVAAVWPSIGARPDIEAFVDIVAAAMVEPSVG